MAKKAKKKVGGKKVSKPNRAVRLALRDVIGRNPKNVTLTIETEKPKDDDGGWSGNVYPRPLGPDPRR